MAKCGVINQMGWDALSPWAHYQVDERGATVSQAHFLNEYKRCQRMFKQLIISTMNQSAPHVLIQHHALVSK